MKRSYHVFISVLTLAICFGYVYWHREQLVMLRSLTFGDLASLFFLFFLFLCSTGYTFMLILDLIKIDLRFTETIGLSVITNFGNYLGPTSPGSAIKAIYLKSAKGLPYSKFTSVFAVNNFLAVFMTGLVGLLLFLFLQNQSTPLPRILLYLSMAFVLGAGAPFLLKIPHVTLKGKIGDIFRGAIGGFKAMRGQRVKLFFVCLSYVIQFAIFGMIFKITFDALGMPISMLMGFTIGVYTTMPTYFPITPSNLGIQEAFCAFLFTVSGYDFTSGIMGAGVIRVVHMIVVFSLAPLFMHGMFKGRDIRKAKFW